MISVQIKSKITDDRLILSMVTRILFTHLKHSVVICHIVSRIPLKSERKFKLLNDGAKRNRFPYLKIMYTGVKKTLYLQ